MKYFRRHKSLQALAEHPGKKGSGQTLTSLEREFLPPLLEIQETPASPLKRAVAWLIAVVCITFMLWAYFGEMDTTVGASGRVIALEGSQVVQADEVSILRALKVKEGQHVRKGQVLAELDATMHGADLTSASDRKTIVELDLARLSGELSGRAPNYSTAPEASATQIALQDNARKAREAKFAASLAQAQAEMSAQVLLLKSETAVFHKAEAALALARHRMTLAQPYVGQAISGFEYMKLTEAVSATEYEVEAEAEKMAAGERTIQARQQRIREIEQERRQQILMEIHEGSINLALLQGDSTKAEGRFSRRELRSPVDGIVQSVEVTTLGGVVTAAQTIMSIVPDDSPLLIEASLKNEDVGQVQVGQHVDIKVDTFPFQRYGVLDGAVEWISPDVSNHALLVSAKEEGSAGAGYRIHVRPTRYVFEKDGEKQHVRLGMSVMIEVHLGRRKIYSYLLWPVLQSLSEAKTGK